MQRKLSIAFLAAIAIGISVVTLNSLGRSDVAGPPTTDAPTSWEEFTFVMDDGSTKTLDDFAGKPLVLNFFASWCPPCRAELPDFEDVYQAKGNEVAFLGLDQDLDEETWREFISETVVTFPTAFADSALYETFGGIGMPTTVFLTADGEVLHVQTGALSKEGLESIIEELFS